MEMKKLSPWNWFKNEQGNEKSSERTTSGGRNLSIQRGEPSVPFMRLQQEIERLFDDAFRGLNFPMMPSFGREEFGGGMQMLRPAVDIAENEKQYLIKIEVPGIDEKDIQVQVDEDALIIQGEKKLEQESEDANFHRIERSFGSFQRVLTLPMDANPDNITANFKNGVLTLSIDRIPEKAPKQPRMIQIKSSAGGETQRKVERTEAAS